MNEGEELPGRLAAPKATAGRGLRHGVAGVAGTGLLYGGLLAVTADDNPLLCTGWVESAAGTARPYGSAVTAGWATFSEATTEILGRVETFAAWPLMALTLFWLASRHQPVYLRSALALFVSNAAGMVVFASLQGFRAYETSLVREYSAFPGVRAGWYVLMALAVLATPARRWVRAAATVIALSTATAAVLTSDHHLLGALSAAIVPLLAWYGPATLRPGRAVGRRRVGAASPATVPRGRVVPLRPRAGAPDQWAASEPVPLSQAG